MAHPDEHGASCWCPLPESHKSCPCGDPASGPCEVCAGYRKDDLQPTCVTCGKDGHYQRFAYRLEAENKRLRHIIADQIAGQQGELPVKGDTNAEA